MGSLVKMANMIASLLLTVLTLFRITQASVVNSVQCNPGATSLNDSSSTLFLEYNEVAELTTKGKKYSRVPQKCGQFYGLGDSCAELTVDCSEKFALKSSSPCKATNDIFVIQNTKLEREWFCSKDGPIDLKYYERIGIGFFTFSGKRKSVGFTCRIACSAEKPAVTVQSDGSSLEVTEYEVPAAQIRVDSAKLQRHKRDTQEDEFKSLNNRRKSDNNEGDKETAFLYEDKESSKNRRKRDSSGNGETTFLYE